jgi:hypothetical protein
MASRRLRHRRLLLPLVLGAILAGEVTGIAIGRSLPPVVVPLAASPTTAGPGSNVPGWAATSLDAVVRSVGAARGGIPVRVGVDLGSRLGSAVSHRAPGSAPASQPKASKSPASNSQAPKPKPTRSSPAPSRSSTGYHGVNHVWIPSLGISKGLQWFPCSRSRPPDAGVYRWGCAGRNNVYLLSHAWSTFEPVHDAYVRGTLRKDMTVFYADSHGRVSRYRVLWWKVTAPTTAASWAWAALPSPGMTLQTCVGKNSEYRLMVRLDRVD